MFGFLRGSRQDLLYRQVYAGCCSFQHRTMGVASLAFLSYEATFLYLMAIDSGAAASPAPCHVTCCKLRRGGKSIYEVEPALAHDCSAFALLLAAVKLADDIADDRSWLARLAQWKLRRQLAAAQAHLEATHTGLGAAMQQHLAEHAAMEQCSVPMPLERYVTPTAEAFGEMFSRFVDILPAEQADRSELFRSVGEAIGASIIAFDCAVDFPLDKKRNQFNPLANPREVERALTYCQRRLAEAGWLCREAFGENSACAGVLSTVFARVSQRLDRPARCIQSRSIWQKLARPGRPQVRMGFCDCCDCCYCPGSDACCDINEVLSGEAMCCCCDCCIAPFDRGKSKKSDSPRNVVGKVGIASSTLAPEGVVMIDGQRYPARSMEGTIEELISVEVVSQDSFGLTVKRAELREKNGL